jgi:predicted transcriptional regulator
MSIDLPTAVEEQLRGLAATQGRDVAVLVEEAVRQYLEATSITDVEAGEVADTQAALIPELPSIAAWKASRA